VVRGALPDRRDDSDALARDEGGEPVTRVVRDDHSVAVAKLEALKGSTKPIGGCAIAAKRHNNPNLRSH
jgi:hypothetical protein